MCNKCKQILLPMSTNMTDWETAKKEWNKEAEEMPPLKTSCICGVNIYKNFKVFNMTNTSSAIVGSVCINTIFTGCNILLDSVNKFVCKICKKQILKTSKDSHNKTKTHLKNVEKAKKMKKCKGCGIMKDRKIEYLKSWSPLCTNCFYKTKGKKKCVQCNKYDKIGDQWTRCYDCNMKNKENKTIRKKLTLFSFDETSDSES